MKGSTGYDNLIIRQFKDFVLAYWTPERKKRFEDYEKSGKKISWREYDRACQIKEIENGNH